MYGLFWRRGLVMGMLAAGLVGRAVAAPAAATVVIGGHTVPFTVAPFVGADGQVYAPADVVHLLGAEFAANSSKTLVSISSPSVAGFTVPSLRVDGRDCVAVARVASLLGGSADWQPTTGVLTVRAKMLMVRQTDAALGIYTSYPVTYSVQHLAKPARIYVDLYGLSLAAVPTSIPVMEDEDHPSNVVRIRSGQINFNTVRITLDLKQDAPFRVVSGPQTDRVRVALGADAERAQIASASVPAVSAVPRESVPVVHESMPVRANAPLRPVPTAPLLVRVTEARPVPTLPVVPAGEGVRITRVGLKDVKDGTIQVVVNTTGPVKYRTETLSGPNRLALDFAGASLDAGVNANLPGVGPIIKAVRAGILHAPLSQFGRVVVDLTRIVGYSVAGVPDGDGMAYTLTLQMPRTVSPSVRPSSANSLSGKIVVVDPGHGAEDTGAIGIDGTREKDLTLKIGRKLRDVLTANGATVYMTREDDVKPSVSARPLFAVAHHADYFVSIHCDSIPGWHTARSGTTVYFHAQNPLCHRMAQDIVNRVAEVSGLPGIGVQTDFIRFPGIGFGVLRGSPMPAVLVECGYLNNDTDLAKLKDDATQQNIALGIVAGLRDFVADRAAR